MVCIGGTSFGFCECVEFSRRLNHVVKKLPFFLANDEAQNEVDDVLGAANYDAMSNVLKNVVNQFKELREVEPAALKKAFELHEFFVDDNKNPKFNVTCELISSLSSIVEKFDPIFDYLLLATLVLRIYYRDIGLSTAHSIPPKP